jgi:muramoyltetrapeptide carboxypeptidase
VALVRAVLCPPALKPGDKIRVIAPSGPFDRTLFFRGLGWLRERYQVVWDRDCLERDGYLAGSDSRRLKELDDALNDPTARALVAARGGYGATRICHAANFESLRRHPKWCVGFSDITAIHLEACRVRVWSLHASNLTALGRSDLAARDAWTDALEHPLRRRDYGALTVLAPGEARGALAGGNLSLVFAMAAARRLALPPGCILVLEEVGEAPYRIDRMLTALVVGGHLRSVSAVCVGDLGSSKDPRGDPALPILGERLGALGVPILAGLPIGHGALNQPLPLGAPALLRSQNAELVVNPDGQD